MDARTQGRNLGSFWPPHSAGQGPRSCLASILPSDSQKMQQPSLLLLCCVCGCRIVASGLDRRRERRTMTCMVRFAATSPPMRRAGVLVYAALVRRGSILPLHPIHPLPARPPPSTDQDGKACEPNMPALFLLHFTDPPIAAHGAVSCLPGHRNLPQLATVV